MSRLESADEIEAIVGANRHATDHLGRAVSAEQRVYVLHSDECRARGIDLRDCEYSIALDRGIDLSIWGDFEDRPVTLAIDAEEGDLLPLITSETPERAAAPDHQAEAGRREVFNRMREIDEQLADHQAEAGAMTFDKHQSIAPDHQLEATSDRPTLVAELRKVAHALEGHGDRYEAGWVYRAIGALAARPVVDDAAVERGAEAISEMHASSYVSDHDRMVSRTVIRAALGGDQ